jgi:hypothetical protein
VILPVPYRSQLAADAGFGKGDCGPASFAMVLNALDVYITVDALGKILQKPAAYTITELRELQVLARQFLVTLEWRGRMTLESVGALIDERRPVIALVWYPLMPNRFDPSYVNGHFVVIVGIEGESVFYHDPYYRDQAGALLKATWEGFSKAWSAVGMGAFNTPRQGLLAPPLPVPEVEIAIDAEIVKAARWWAEEGVRQGESGAYDRAKDIYLNEVIPRLYSIEGLLS